MYLRFKSIKKLCKLIDHRDKKAILETDLYLDTKHREDGAQQAEQESIKQSETMNWPLAR